MELLGEKSTDINVIQSARSPWQKIHPQEPSDLVVLRAERSMPTQPLESSCRRLMFHKH